MTKSHFFRDRLLVRVIIVLFVGFMTLNASADNLEIALGMRDGAPSAEKLIEIAGNEDKLVSRLLELRLSDQPFVSSRSLALLLKYSHREEVKTALLEDMLAADRRGLAKQIVTGINSVSDSAFRLSIAKSAVARASFDKKFVDTAKILESSEDVSIKEVAKSIK